MNCIQLKQKFNQAKLKQEKALILNKRDVTEAAIREIRDCGYNIKEVKNKLIITE